jgi:hypothetical protein
MSAIKRIRVTISDSKLIPTIGKGPIHSPISITEDQYNMLVNLGYKVVKAGAVKVAKIETAPVQEPVEPVVEVTEVIEPEVAQEEEVVVVEEEPVVEEEKVVTEEVAEESDEDVAYTMEDLAEATKKELKAVLDKRGVAYGYNDTLKELKEAVVASNPA